MSITIDGVEYASLAAAARAVGTAPRTLRRRLKARAAPYTLADLRRDGRADLGPVMRAKLANHDRRARLRAAMTLAAATGAKFSPAAFARAEGVSRQNIQRLVDEVRQESAHAAEDVSP